MPYSHTTTLKRPFILTVESWSCKSKTLNLKTKSMPFKTNSNALETKTLVSRSMGPQGPNDDVAHGTDHSAHDLRSEAIFKRWFLTFLFNCLQRHLKLE